MVVGAVALIVKVGFSVCSLTTVVASDCALVLRPSPLMKTRSSLAPGWRKSCGIESRRSPRPQRLSGQARRSTMLAQQGVAA